MPPPGHDIRYICLSDLHLGEQESVLTPLKPRGPGNGVPTAAPMLERLAVCLRHLVEQNEGAQLPTLIVAGDGLGLAFGSYQETLTLFGFLMESLFEPGAEVCDSIVYIPGNHDHHIWELAREAGYARQVGDSDKRHALPPPAHVTSPLPTAGLPSDLLNSLATRIGGGGKPVARVDVIYPNLALVRESSDRCVLIHHGHYAEDVYRFFSIARRALFPGRPGPATVEEIENENYAWVDFVWSLLGRSGEAGRDFEALFLTLRNPDHVRARASELAGRMAKALDLPLLPSERLERMVIKKSLDWYAGRFVTERFVRDGPYSESTMEGLQRYVFGPSFRQLEEAIGHVPGDLTVVFGHTHKPFESIVSPKGVEREVKVFNTGGWTIDSRRPLEQIGAAILFMNDALDVASLRLYNDGPDGGTMLLDVHGAEGRPGGTEFGAALEERLRGGTGKANLADVWDDLGVSLHRRIKRRRELNRSQADA